MFTSCHVPARTGDRSLRSVVLVFSIVASAAFFPADVRAGETLAFEQALRMAQDRSRQMAAQELAAAASREMALAAGQLPDPMLRLGISSLPIDGADRFSLTRDFMTMRTVAVAQEFTREEKRRARTARFQREAEAAQAERLLALSNLQRDTALAWLNRYYQERLRNVLAAQREETRLQIEAADAAYRSGRGSQADVFTARTAVALIDDRIDQADRQVSTATTQLARWVGGEARNPLGELPRTDFIRLQPADLESQIIHHPQLVALARQEEVSLAESQIARTDKLPDIGVELMYSQRGPAFSNMVSFNVSIPLQWNQSNRQDRELAAKLALVHRIRAQREEATRAHVAETQTMLKEWQSNRARLARYEDSLVPLASERTRAAVAAYRGGVSPLMAVLEARRAEIDTRIESLRLEWETGRLWAQLNFLIPTGHAAGVSPP